MKKKQKIWMKMKMRIIFIEEEKEIENIYGEEIKSDEEKLF